MALCLSSARMASLDLRPYFSSRASFLYTSHFSFGYGTRDEMIYEPCDLDVQERVLQAEKLILRHVGRIVEDGK